MCAFVDLAFATPMCAYAFVLVCLFVRFMLIQVIGNFASGGEEERNRAWVWDRCFPGTFSRLSAVLSSVVLSPLCMRLFTCCKGTNAAAQQRAASLCSSEGDVILISLLRAEVRRVMAAAGGRMDQVAPYGDGTPLATQACFVPYVLLITSM